jgi:hypothetical protein
VLSNLLTNTGLETVCEVLEVCDDPHDSSDNENGNYSSSSSDSVLTSQKLLLGIERLVSGADSSIPAVINA